MAVTRMLSWGLVASVTLNLLLAGIAGGLVWQNVKPPGPPPDFGADLSAEGRKALFATAVKNRARFTPLFEDARTARSDLAQVLSAETFDTQGYDTAAERLKAAQTRILEEKSKAMREAALSMPPEERRKLARRLSAGPEGHSRHGGPGNGGDMHPQGIQDLPPISPPSPADP